MITNRIILIESPIRYPGWKHHTRFSARRNIDQSRLEFIGARAFVHIKNQESSKAWVQVLERDSERV